MFNEEDIYEYIVKYYIMKYNTRGNEFVINTINGDMSIYVSEIEEELDKDYFFVKHVRPYIDSYVSEVNDIVFSGMMVNTDTIHSVINLLVSSFKSYDSDSTENVFKKIKRSIILDSL